MCCQSEVGVKRHLLQTQLSNAAQVKMNPARSDNMIIQSICLLDQLDKDLNTFAMRVREWYCWHFPELRELVKDNYMFARCAAFIKVRGVPDTPRVRLILAFISTPVYLKIVTMMAFYIYFSVVVLFEFSG